MNNREETIRLLEFNARDGKNHVQVVEHLIAELERVKEAHQSELAANDMLLNALDSAKNQLTQIKKERDELANRIKLVGEKINWLAVDEALPNHGEEVLTVTEDNWYRITQFGSIGKGKFPSQVTHWMELPKPPTCG